MTWGNHKAYYENIHGRPLCAHDVEQVRQLRAALAHSLPAGYDTDFNLFRWILSARHSHHRRPQAEVLAEAQNGLRAHLKLRTLLNLDSDDIPTMDDNPLFRYRFLPGGKLSDGVDAHNRILYFLQQKSLDLQHTTQILKSSEIIKWQLYLFEYLLRLVNEQEQRTGLMSAVHQLVDMSGYNMGPVTMLFVNNGQLAYYARVLHYDHYPELLTPVETCHSGALVAIAYRLIKQAMPHGFADRFKVTAGAPSARALACVPTEHLPDYFGGANKQLSSTPACAHTMAAFDRPLTKAERRNADALAPAAPVSLHLPAGRVLCAPFAAHAGGASLSWRFTTDGDLYFGVFRGRIHPRKIEKHQLVEDDMVYPWFKLCAKLVPEADGVELDEAADYTMVLSNAHSWLTGRTVNITAMLDGVQLQFVNTD